MGVVCGYLIVLVFIDDDNKLGSWKKKKKKKKKKLKKDRSFRTKRLNIKLFS